MAKDTYAGKIKNTGSQVVSAIYPVSKGKSSTKKTGEDLRTKGGNK